MSKIGLSISNKGQKKSQVQSNCIQQYTETFTRCNEIRPIWSFTVQIYALLVGFKEKIFGGVVVVGEASNANAKTQKIKLHRPEYFYIKSSGFGLKPSL